MMGENWIIHCYQVVLDSGGQNLILKNPSCQGNLGKWMVLVELVNDLGDRPGQP